MAYLVNIGILLGIGEYVEGCVQIVQQLDNLHGSLRVGILGTVIVEAHHTAEEQRNAFVLFGRHRTLVAQLVGHGGRQNGVQ